MPPTHQRFASRRAFTAAPIVFLLLVAFAGMLVWRVLALGTFLSNMFGPNMVDWERIIWSHILIGLAGTAITGGIGAGAYFAAGKSDRAANLIMGLLLAGGAGWFGYLNVGQVFKFKPNGPQPPAVPYSARNSTPAPAPAPTFPSPRPPVPLTQPQQSPSGVPTPSPQPLVSPTPGTPRSSPPPSPPPSDPVDPRIQEVTDLFIADTMSGCDRVGTSFDSLVKTLRQPPERSRSALDSIVQQIDALDKDRAIVAAALNSAPADLQARLIDAGVSKDAAVAHATHGMWSGQLKASWRRAGVDSMGRVMEPCREQAVLLRDSIGKWTLKGGDPDFGKDREMQRKVDWARQRMSGALMQADFASKQVRGQ